MYCSIPFATKLNPSGAVIYSTFLQLSSASASGNQQSIGPSKIAVDSAGALYITGVAELNDGSVLLGPNNFLPLSVNTGAFQTTPGSVFAMKLNPTGTALDYATYLDGHMQTGFGEVGTGGANPQIAVNPTSGQAYIAGNAMAGYPTTFGAYQQSNPSVHASPFLTALSPDGSSLIYSTYFGSAGPGGMAYGVALDSTGDATIVGQEDLPPTTPNAFCGTPSAPGSESAFIAKFNATGSSLVYATTLCGSFDSANAIAIDSSGDAYIAGVVSEAPTLPLVQPIEDYPPPGQTSVSGEVVLKLGPSGTVLWSTLLGDNNVNGEELPDRVALDPTMDLYVLTASSFVTTPSALNPNAPVSLSAPILVKIAPSLGAPVPIIWPSTSFSFGNGEVGSSSAPIDVPVGNFGDASMSPTVSITAGFTQTNNCSSPVPGGQKCDINVAFAPTTTGAQTGTITVSFGGGIRSQTVQLSGTGTAPAVQLAPTSLVFPPQTLNTTSAAQPVTITNNGTGLLTITTIAASGDFAQTNACGAPVAPMSTCQVQVTFTPRAQGFRSGTLSITDNASGSPQTVPLQGYGGSATTAALKPSMLTFGSQSVGVASSAQSVMLTNSGTVTLAISSISATGDFAQTNTCGTSVAAAGNCQISVTFRPTAAGSRTGSVIIIDNTAGTPQVVMLAGRGASPSLGLGVPSGGSSSATVAPGATASYMLAIGGAGMAGTASLSCTGAPTGATCTVPAMATVSASTPSTFTVSVTTTASSLAIPAMFKKLPRNWIWPVGILALAILVVSSNKKRVRWSVAMAAVPALLICSCGGGSGGGRTNPTATPAGTYQLTVNATSGSTTQSVALTLVVQ
jgi:hypothetical protein